MYGPMSTSISSLRSLGKKDAVIPRDEKYKGTVLQENGKHYIIKNKMVYPDNHVVQVGEAKILAPRDRRIDTVFPTNLTDADLDKLATFMTTS